MFRYLIGKKIGQSQMFDTEGKRIPVTTIGTSSCYIVDIVKHTNGTVRFILGLQKGKNPNKPTQAKLDKAGITAPLRFFKELIVDVDSSTEITTTENKKSLTIGEKTFTVGEEIKAVDLFKEGDIVDVSGTSKGKGFQGVVKRHGFRGGPRTHGQSDRERAPGSLGQTTTPGRVYKGKRMAGRMGSDKITVKNLMVMAVSETEMTVKGLVPGNKQGILKITNQTK